MKCPRILLVSNPLIGSRIVLPLVWLAMVAGVSMAMVFYAATPGPADSAPKHWPSDSRISPAGGISNLIVFVHPHCPCSRATIGELEILLAESHRTVSAQVWFIHPKGTPNDWTKTALWRTASAIPGVTVHEDHDLTESRRFHVDTSGQALLYDSEQNLLFQGGITISRGHAGPNPGRDALTALLKNFQLAPFPVSGPVYGCPLVEEIPENGGSQCRR